MVLLKMKECLIFTENGKNIAVYTNYQKFRRLSFHYILDFLLYHNKFENKLEAGKSLKSQFTKFYGKNHVPLEFEDQVWGIETFCPNELENIYKVEKKLKDYDSEFTKINPIKGPKNFSSLNNDLKLIPLTPLYGK